MLPIQITDPAQEHAIIERFQRERSDEYHEIVERTRQFHDELALERRRGRATYTELEESDTDLSRHQKWLTAVTSRDYFGAPGAAEAQAAVTACEEALAEFETEALAHELDTAGETAKPPLRAVDDGR